RGEVDDDPPGWWRHPRGRPVGAGATRAPGTPSVNPQVPPDFPTSVEVVIEIPRGSRNKYEFDEATGALRLDRVLSAAVFYPHEYGFIDGTRAGDGDHTD